MNNKITEALKEVIKKLNVEIKIELTPSKNHGDFSTNIAMKLVKKLNDNPINIANKIIEKIDKNKYGIKNIKVASPGFINFFMKRNALNTIISNILQQKDNYGKGNNGDYINVEYVSANPTGYLHLGHARGAAVGSALVNILKFTGNKVDSEYYVNDVGNQIDKLGLAVFIRYLQEHNKNIKMPKNTYNGKDIVWVAKQIKEKYKNKYINYKYEKVADIFKEEAKKILIKEINKDLKLFGVKFNIYSLESDLYKNNLIKPTLNRLKDTFKKNGATWLKTTKYDDDKDRVLIKSDGTYTYLTPDIANHHAKLKRGYNYLINIWGSDHIGYIKRMEIALRGLGYENALKKTLIIQLVKLIKNNKELKMSKRTGSSFTLRKLIKIAGKDATRFFMIHKSCNSKFDFDIDLATQQNSSNPVFYIQYAHARANQILKKSGKKITTIKLNTKGADELINILSKFPELIKKISKNQKIHLLSQYLIDVAKLFHSFYNSEKILQSKNESSKLAIIKAAKQVIKNGLSLLGIEAPERM